MQCRSNWLRPASLTRSATRWCRRTSVAQDLIKAEQRTRLQQLTAPVDGVVQLAALVVVPGRYAVPNALMAHVAAGRRAGPDALPDRAVKRLGERRIDAGDTDQRSDDRHARHLPTDQPKLDQRSVSGLWCERMRIERGSPREAGSTIFAASSPVAGQHWSKCSMSTGKSPMPVTTYS